MHIFIDTKAHLTAYQIHAFAYHIHLNKNIIIKWVTAFPTCHSHSVFMLIVRFIHKTTERVQAPANKHVPMGQSRWRFRFQTTNRFLIDFLLIYSNRLHSESTNGVMVEMLAVIIDLCFTRVQAGVSWRHLVRIRELSRSFELSQAHQWPFSKWFVSRMKRTRRRMKRKRLCCDRQWNMFFLSSCSESSRQLVATNDNNET